jgi:hypothetical protein
LSAVGDGRDDNLFAVPFELLLLPLPLHPDGALPVLVDLAQRGPVGDDLAAEREVRPLHLVEQVGDGGVRLVDQQDGRLQHLGQVVRGDLRGHADGDAGGAVDQQVREPGRQHHRLAPGAVVTGGQIDRLAVQFAQQQFGLPRQLRLGVPVRGRRVAVHRPEVPLPVHQRHAQHPVLRHADQRLVERGVAVRVVVAHHLADDLGALERLLVHGQVQVVVHRVQDAPLHRLETVAHVRQRAAGHHRHGVGEEPVAHLLGDGNGFDRLGHESAPAVRRAPPRAARRPVNSLNI